ncbi:RHS repeat-associated core domain-containing protein, partial [Pleomorphovibrio marinus]|uniref:RHS repeat-associated core domain-containing protein n=1 Tax=Pleomorphovibrio marinus TaxID=2164132 RepID=UPI00293725E3
MQGRYEELTEWYDFHAREYDAALGRWFGVDPQNQFASPYLAMGNNPVMMVDPDGEFAVTAMIVGALVLGTGN